MMMNRKVVVIAALLFAFSGVVYAGCPGDQVSGWFYPTGTRNIGSYLGWHGVNTGFSGVHLAQDIDADENDSVCAISDGVVMIARTDVSYYGGASNCTSSSVNPTSGAGVVIRHTSSGGEQFDVLYAHLKNLSVSTGDVVAGGSKIGEVRNYTWCGDRMDHLHFALAAPRRADSNYAGSGSADVWAGYGTADKGFVDPFPYLTIRKPGSPSCLGSVCGDAVVYHGKLRTAQTVRFGLEMISVTDVGWRPFTERCEEAKQYFYLAKSNPTSQKFMAMPAPSSICADVVQACFAQ